MATIPTLDGQTARLQPIQTSPLPREAFGGGAEIRETAQIFDEFEKKNKRTFQEDKESEEESTASNAGKVSTLRIAAD
jgi:hypothetical protein